MPLVTDALTSVPRPGPISLRLAGAGRFGSVIWAGVHGDLERLAAFRENIRRDLTEAGFPIDARPFRPHFTISYRYDRRLATTLETYSGPSWTTHEFVLVDSVDGDYLPLSKHPLSPV